MERGVCHFDGDNVEAWDKMKTERRGINREFVARGEAMMTEIEMSGR